MEVKGTDRHTKMWGSCGLGTHLEWHHIHYKYRTSAHYYVEQRGEELAHISRASL